MKELKKRIGSASGFTLIELLLVIVIIGILAGVLIAVIDPQAQQSKARDANVKATLNKVALATQGYVSAYGNSPNDVQFLAGLSASASSPNASCAAGGADYTCDFIVTGNQLPDTCGAVNGYTGSTAPGSGNTCLYRYVGTASSPNFTVYAKSFGAGTTVFRYMNNGTAAGQIQHCDTATPPANCVTP